MNSAKHSSRQRETFVLKWSRTCRSLSRHRILSTSRTPLVYFSMYVSPSSVSSLSPRAAIKARVSRSSGSSDACSWRQQVCDQCIQKEETVWSLYLWYVGHDLIRHSTGVQNVLQRHPSLQALSETLGDISHVFTLNKIIHYQTSAHQVCMYLIQNTAKAVIL